MKRKTALFSILLLVAAIGSAPIARATEVVFEQHTIDMFVDPAPNAIGVVDKTTAMVTPGWNWFSLAAGTEIHRLVLAGEWIDYSIVTDSNMANLGRGLQDALASVDISPGGLLVCFETMFDGRQTLEVAYGAKFFQDVSNTRFSNEMVGGEITGTISENGAYLSPSCHFYAQGGEATAHFRLTAHVPMRWESISDGNRLFNDVIDSSRVQTWENPYASDGLSFFAAPFKTGSVIVDSVEVACYFFEEDTALIADYLTATTRYIEMYNDLIGPYPYERFTVVENFFPTGYGMPGWTLLGQQVLRLPFIKHTSLGHEVLHNWWGNSVFVDYESGNWCEGLTVYGADYRYKLLQSPDAAREYRKDILNQYLSYIDEGNDFPIREFASRTSPSTRTIGYNKTMMVFHMIENEIGTEAFFDAWRLVYKEHRGMKVSWEDWLAAFESTSGQSLAHVIPQWIDRTGAPVLAVKASFNDKGQPVIELSQTQEEIYDLQVPVRFESPDYSDKLTVSLKGRTEQIVLGNPTDEISIAVDPDYTLFRKLYPEEVEPIISSITGQTELRFFHTKIHDPDETFMILGENLTGSENAISVEDILEVMNNPGGYCPVVLNLDPLPEYLASKVTVDGDSLTIADTKYPRDGHTFVLCGQGWNEFERYMVVLSDDFESLPRIGQLLPHYGKYSYLVFEGPSNVAKGKWTVDSSPLRVTLSGRTE